MGTSTKKTSGSAAVKQRLVQAGGATSQDLGLGRTLGQVLVFLYLTDGECPLDRIEADLGEDIIIESRPRLEGRQMVMMIAPKKK